MFLQYGLTLFLPPKTLGFKFCHAISHFVEKVVAKSGLDLFHFLFGLHIGEHPEQLHLHGVEYCSCLFHFFLNAKILII